MKHVPAFCGSHSLLLHRLLNMWLNKPQVYVNVFVCLSGNSCEDAVGLKKHVASLGSLIPRLSQHAQMKPLFRIYCKLGRA